MPDPADNYEAAIEGFPIPADPDSRRARLPVEVLASQFMQEVRRGENPTVEDYAERFPRLAAEIRSVFPVMIAMEELKQKKQADNLRESVPEQFHIQELGRCRMLREIGRGGMGVVFEAVQDDGQQVALKLLPWHTAGIPGWKERFAREARTTRAMRHPNIVPILRVGQQDRYTYFVMQLVDGVGLDWVIAKLKENNVVRADEIAQAGHRPRDVSDIDTDCEIPIELLGQLEDAEPVTGVDGPTLHLHSWRDFALIVRDAARALGYAHRKGVLHNDVKPGNLLMNASRKVWMTDFGLAQPIGAGDPDERLVGTLRYMAPERIRGEQTVQTDVYSLGMTLYELVTQTPAFAADCIDELLDRILTQEPRRPREINHAIPVALETVICNAISADPDDRYRTAAELELDLTLFVNGSNVSPRRTETRSSLFGRLLARLTGRGAEDGR